VTLAAAVAALLAVYGVQLYGLALFIGVPVFIGFATTALIANRPRPFLACLGWSTLAATLLSTGFIVFGLEGFICLLMYVPLAVPVIAIGTWIAWALFHHHRLPRAGATTVALFAALLAATAVEPQLAGDAPPVYVASDSLTIDGTPDEVWQAIVELDDVPTPDDLVFRAGIATPQKTRIETCAVGGLRVCTMSTGTLVERIDAWEPGRRLGWRALSTPPPMRELNPFHADVDPPHLHGTYRNVRGEFALEPAEEGRTRVTRRTWYEHDLYPSAYWRIWCDWGASKIHLLVLEHLRGETLRRRGGKSV
jgi:hypothetical protein